MISKKLLVILVLITIFSNTNAICTSTLSTETKTYIDNKHGFKFNYPNTWEVTTNTDLTNDPSLLTLVLQPKNWKEIEEKEGIAGLYIIYLDFYELNFESAVDVAGLMYEEGKWMIYGRTGLEDSGAEKISSSKWIGIKGTVTIGMYKSSEEWGYVGLGDNIIVILNNRGKCSVTFNGGPQSESVLDLILNSFQFFTRIDNK